MDPALEELRDVYEKGNLVLFVGAGVSAAAGLPSWPRLIELLVERARARNVPTSLIAEIEEFVVQKKLIDAMTAAKDALGDAEFGAVVTRNLDDRGRDVPDVALAIAALAPRLKAILTTNIDHLLEHAMNGTMPTLARATGAIAQDRGFLLKLHGTLLERDTWVFSRDEYERVMYADPRLRTAFSALFNAHTLLFVGYGLTDEDFDHVLGQVRALAGGQQPRHFALVADATVTSYRQKQLDKAGLRVIPYSNSDGRHTEVVRILRDLAAPTPAGAIAAGPVASESTAAVAHAGVSAVQPTSVAVRMKGVKSRQGGVHVDDGTGRGIDLENIEAEKDVTARTEARDSSPKA